MAAIGNIRGPAGATLASICFWLSNAVAALANQGLNLLAALTELDSAVQGTRVIVESADVGNQVQIAVNARIIAAGAGTTIAVSIRDVSNTANVLATVSFSGAVVGTQVVKSSYVAKPVWLTGDKTLAVYTSGGNGAADFIFKSVTLRSKN